MKIAIYTDINTINETNGLTKDNQAIIQALYNLITTEQGERPYRHNLGFSASNYIFESFDSVNAFQLKTDLLAVVRDQEPRVLPDFSLSRVVESPQNNSYRLKLVYSIVGLDNNKFEFLGEIFR
jgi:phage baseplate assembly protein W